MKGHAKILNGCFHKTSQQYAMSMKETHTITLINIFTSLTINRLRLSYINMF